MSYLLKLEGAILELQVNNSKAKLVNCLKCKNLFLNLMETKFIFCKKVLINGPEAMLQTPVVVTNLIKKFNKPFKNFYKTTN